MRRSLALLLTTVLCCALGACRTRLPGTPYPVTPSATAQGRAGGALPVPGLEGIDPEILKPGPWEPRVAFRGLGIPHAEFEDETATVATWISSFRVGVSKRVGLGATLDFDVVWENRKYEWSGTNDLLPGTNVPVTMSNGFGANLRYIQPFHPEWGAFVDLTARLEAEKGAYLGDGASWGAFAGIGKRFPSFGKGADVGVGFGVISRPGGQRYYIPVVQGSWRIDDRWDVAFRGPAVTVTAKLSEQWKLAGVVAFDSARIRLNDEAPGNSGIFTDSRLTTQLRATWSPIEQLDLEAWLGMDVYRELFFANEDDTDYRSFRMRPAPVFGTRIVVRF